MGGKPFDSPGTKIATTTALDYLEPPPPIWRRRINQVTNRPRAISDALSVSSGPRPPL
jgi:hypothetical protein